MSSALHGDDHLPQKADGANKSIPSLSTNVPIFILASGQPNTSELCHNEHIDAMNFNHLVHFIPSNLNFGSHALEPSFAMPLNAIGGNQNAEIRNSNNEKSQTTPVRVDGTLPLLPAAVPAPAPSTGNELTINGFNLPPMTIKGVKAVYVVRETSHDCPCSQPACSMSSNTLTPQTLSAISSASQLASNSPVFIGNPANNTFAGSVCPPTHTTPTHLNLFQQHVSVSNPSNSMVFTSVVPQVQQQTCINLNPAAPFMVWPAVPPPSYQIATMNNSGTNTVIASKTPPSTFVMSSAPPLPSTFVMSTAHPQPSPFVMSAVPPPPSTFVMSTIPPPSTLVTSTIPPPSTLVMSTPTPLPSTLATSSVPLPTSSLVMSTVPPTYSTLAISTVSTPPITSVVASVPQPTPSNLVKSAGPTTPSARVIFLSPVPPPSSTRVMPTALSATSPYPIALVSNCSTNANLSRNTPPSTDPVSVLTAEPPPPYSTGIFNVAGKDVNVASATSSVAEPPPPYPTTTVKVEPSISECVSNDTQTLINESDVFNMTGLQPTLKCELADSQAEEMTVEVDPANYWDSSDTDSPVKGFSSYQPDEPDAIISQPKPIPYLHYSQAPGLDRAGTNLKTYSIPYWQKVASSCQIQSSLDSANVRNQPGINAFQVSKVSESGSNYFNSGSTAGFALNKQGCVSKKNPTMERTFTPNLPPTQVGLDGETEGYSVQIEFDNDHRPVSIVSKPCIRSADKVSLNSFNYQHQQPLPRILPSSQIETPNWNQPAPLKSNLIHQLVCNVQLNDANTSANKELGCRPLQMRYPAMPQVASESRIQHPESDHPYTNVKQRILSKPSDDKSHEKPIFLWNNPQHRIESNSAFDTRKPKVYCRKEVTTTPTEMARITVNMEHNYSCFQYRPFVRSGFTPAPFRKALPPLWSTDKPTEKPATNLPQLWPKRRPPKISATNLQEEMQKRWVAINFSEKESLRRCHVVLKRLHPSHFEDSVVNLRLVRERDLFQPARRSNRLQKRKCHWNKTRKVRVWKTVKNSPQVQNSQPPKEIEREKTPPRDDVEVVVKTETPPVELMASVPPSCHSGVSAMEGMTRNDSNAALPVRKRQLVVKLEVLENWPST